MSDPSSAISQLQANWFQLHDLDRARSVANIRRSGTSIRQIARDLGFSPSLLRHLLEALKAPAEDQALARQHLISTRELVRRAQAANSLRAERHRHALERERTEAAKKGADLIANWLIESRVNGPDGEHVIDKVRSELAEREWNGMLSPVPTGLPRLPRQELIQRCRPKTACPEDAESLSWHHEWLFRWTYFMFPDPEIRWKALDLALERQWAR